MAFAEVGDEIQYRVSSISCAKLNHNNVIAAISTEHGDSEREEVD